MRLLIDTQIFIWTVLDSDKLGPKTRQIMLNMITIIRKRLQFLERLSLKVKNLPGISRGISEYSFVQVR